mmetsp:Transcript_26559/g.53982  ORF Transcript_26559/g.53982 Transcript_26559/m.53982 type:complete len:368 (+) Transcript_26559:18-1121(+)
MKQIEIILAILTVVVAAILSSAPGWSDPQWSNFEPPPPPNDEGWISFPGGRDGTAKLWGRVALPDASSADAAGGATPEKPPPVVVLAPGGGLSHDCGMGMAPFVEAFVTEGYAVLTFDYATFGASGNGDQPRHTVDPVQHVLDLKAAVSAVRSRSKELGVDGDRIALWGVSLSGSHVLVAASEEGGVGPPGVRAVCSLVPMLANGFSALTESIPLNPRPFSSQAKILALILKGMLLGIIGRPWYINFYGPDGSASAQQTPENNNGYASLAPPGGGEYDWRNGMTSSSLFKLFPYNPLSHVASIKVPVSLVAAGDDTICRERYARSASEQIEGSELVVIPNVGHFGIWYGEPLEQVLDIQLNFLRRNL